MYSTAVFNGWLARIARAVRVELGHTGDDLVFHAVNSGSAPAWIVDNDIYIRSKGFNAEDKTHILRLWGKAWHEVGHYLYTPRRRSSLVQLALAEHLWGTMNLLEDMRNETLMAATSRRLRTWFTHMVITDVLQGQVSDGAWLYVAGREYLPADLRNACRAAWVEGAHTTDEMEAVAKEYTRMVPSKNPERALELIRLYSTMGTTAGCGQSPVEGGQHNTEQPEIPENWEDLDEPEEDEPGSPGDGEPEDGEPEDGESEDGDGGSHDGEPEDGESEEDGEPEDGGSGEGDGEPEEDGEPGEGDGDSEDGDSEDGDDDSHEGGTSKKNRTPKDIIEDILDEIAQDPDIERINQADTQEVAEDGLADIADPERASIDHVGAVSAEYHEVIDAFEDLRRLTERARSGWDTNRKSGRRLNVNGYIRNGGGLPKGRR